MTREAERMDWAMRQRPKYAGDKLVLIMLASRVDARSDRLVLTERALDVLAALCCATPEFVSQCLATLAEQKLISLTNDAARLMMPEHETLPG